MTAGLSVALALCMAPSAERERVAIPGTALTVELVRIPASADGAAPALLVGVTEVPWELYDCFVYGLDEPAAATGASGGTPHAGTAPPQPADAVTRPTKPYISVDRGFGHAGWPAISMSFRGAKSFCEWLRAKTGRPFRLPTVAEWSRLCEAAGSSGAALEARAWIAANSGGTTRKVGSATPDALGLHDLCGNVSEWCVAQDGTGVVLGGSYRDGADAVGCAAMQRDTPNWNRSDPQFPKSVWWLADAPHVGMRLVCDAPAAVTPPDPAPATAPAPVRGERKVQSP
jgi:hypothetical protein